MQKLIHLGQIMVNDQVLSKYSNQLVLLLTAVKEQKSVIHLILQHPSPQPTEQLSSHQNPEQLARLAQSPQHLMNQFIFATFPPPDQ